MFGGASSANTRTVSIRLPAVVEALWLPANTSGTLNHCFRSLRLFSSSTNTFFDTTVVPNFPLSLIVKDFIQAFRTNIFFVWLSCFVLEKLLGVWDMSSGRDCFLAKLSVHRIFG